MKKNLFISAFLLIGLLWYVSSCVKDTFTEEDAFASQKDLSSFDDSLKRSNALLLDSLRHTGGLINYSVAAVLASDASWTQVIGSWGYGGKGTGETQLDGVTVTVSQYGVVKSVTTDASGIAAFKELRIGNVNVNIRKTGYTEVDFVALLPPLGNTDTCCAYDIVRNVGTMVPVFSLTTNLATITGIATIETDLTNDAPELAANAEIIGTIDVDHDAFQRYFYHPSHLTDPLNTKWFFEYYGTIKQIAFHSTVSKATSAADGTFSLKVPSTPDGLPIILTASQIAATQKLLQPTLNSVPVWGVQSVRTLFGPWDEDFYYSEIPQIGYNAPYEVQPAYVQFSAPTGTAAAQPTTVAQATAVLSSSGIISVNITNPGSGYTQAPKVVFSHGSGWNSVNAEGTAVLTNGSVTAVTITSAGTGYLPTDAPTITFSENINIAAAATPIFSYSLTGLTIPLGGNGSGYTSTAPSVTIAGDGTGATAHAIMAGLITKANITSPGAGYTATPKVVISDGKGNTDLTATADMTDANPLASAVYVKPGALYPLYDDAPAAVPTVVISGGGGSGATGTCTLSTTGEISVITIGAPGAGYTTASVSITGGSGWATARANIVGTGVTSITIIDGGYGYTSDPIVTITGDGAGATATATVRYPISTINLTSAGSGYTAKPNFTVGGSSVTADVDVKFLMMVEGINYSAIKTYEAQPVATITSINGVGSGAAATFDVSWGVGALVVDNGGSGYTYIPNVIIAPPAVGGTTASGTASLGNGVLKEVIVDQPGMGYTAAPHAEIAVAGSPYNVTKEAVLAATVTSGQVTGITVSNAGTGYPYLTTYTVKISTFKTPGAATANPNPKSGQIDFIRIDNPGAGYAITPNVEIVNPSSSADANGFGKGATATAVVTDGRISAITVTAAGSGYYVVPTVRITVPSALVKAVGMCVVDDTDGRITGVSFPGWKPYTQGYGYVTAPTVTFFPSVTGKGTGATGVAVIENGQVVDVVMTNQGSGYLGKNNPGSTIEFTIVPPNFEPLIAKAGKTYIRDVFFGTGMRMSIEDYSWWEDWDWD